MKIEEKPNGTELTVTVSGRLDTNTSPGFKESLEGKLEGLTALKIDMQDLEYISSAGLRVLLSLHKESLKKNIPFTISGCSDVVKDIFNVTGFTGVLNIE